MNTENRRAAAARIRALLSKTVDNGCTEEEAMAAAAKAGELMDRYGIESSEVEIRAEKCTAGSHRSRAGKRGDRERANRASEITHVAIAIAKFCTCRVWTSGPEVRFFGLPHDVEVAVYMSDAIETAMRSSFRRYRKGPDRPPLISGHALRSDFMGAMASRLSHRLDEMRRARDGEKHQTSDGRSLVAVKGQVVEEQYSDYAKLHNMKLRPGGTYSWRHGDAAAAGRAAADAHEFRAGVTSRTAGLIGAR